MCICQHLLINVLIAALPELTLSPHERQQEVLSADCDPSKTHLRTLKQTMPKSKFKPSKAVSSHTACREVEEQFYLEQFSLTVTFLSLLDP